MQEMKIEQALTLIAIFTPLNLFLWFGVGLGSMQAPIRPAKTSQRVIFRWLGV
ncbi:putative phage membrane protein [Streptococcus suis]|uniref:Putative phage membrane protein n=1 Tax=Streptococcus suis TaxID=1307 RepID=A0A0Z8X889_STRSU|nr:putative phage membrane protein [Streptococcus suis]